MASQMLRREIERKSNHVVYSQAVSIQHAEVEGGNRIGS
jgi:hypothetical protein